MYRLDRPSSSHQCRVRGLVASCSTWVSQVAARTRGAPLPYAPTASLTPSGAVQKRISGRSGTEPSSAADEIAAAAAGDPAHQRDDRERGQRGDESRQYGPPEGRG